MTKPITTLASAGAAVLALSFACSAPAGDINPPAGPVTPTMVTLDDIYDEVRGDDAGAGNHSYYMQIDTINGEVDGVQGVPPDSIGVNRFVLSSQTEAAGGRFELDPILIELSQDTTTPQLFTAIATHRIIPEMTIQGYVRGPGAAQPTLVQEWVLTNVALTRLDAAAGGSEAGGTLIELVAQEICMEYWELRDNGSLGQSHLSCWSLSGP